MLIVIEVIIASYFSFFPLKKLLLEINLVSILQRMIKQVQKILIDVISRQNCTLNWIMVE